MDQRSPQQMTPDEIVAEIGSIHKDLSVRFSRLSSLSQGLYRNVRRSPVDDNTAVYITYANAWMRFAGASNHGVVRTASAATRVLRRLIPVQPEGAKPEQQQKKAKAVQQPSQEQSPVEDLISMYGEDSGQTGVASEDAKPVMADA